MSRWSDYPQERRDELNKRRRAHHAAHREERKVKAHENYVQNKLAYRTRAKAYFEANREAVRIYARDVVRFRNYGLTKEMFEEFLDAQEGACAFCGWQLPIDTSNIAIDHDHATGAYRGLVHNRCNLAIGLGEMHLEGYLAAAAS